MKRKRIIGIQHSLDNININLIQNLIKQTNLYFHIVDDEALEKFNEYELSNNPPFLMDDEITIINEKLKELLGDNVILRKIYKNDFKNDADDDVNDELKELLGDDWNVPPIETLNYTILKKEPGLTGERIIDAELKSDPYTLDPKLIFTLDNEGTNIFWKLTTENVGKSLAIILDNNVKTQAKIHEPINSNKISITGFNKQESEELLILLQSGYLPCKLEIVEESTNLNNEN